MNYNAEDYIEFIENERKDKISFFGLQIIAKKFREQQETIKKLSKDESKLSFLERLLKIKFKKVTK